MDTKNDQLQPQPGGEPHKPRRIMIFSNWRIASNLWLKIFDAHPALRVNRYIIIFAAMLGPDRFIEFHSPEGRDIIAESQHCTYRRQFHELLDFIHDVESQNRIPFFKEHIFSVLSYEALASKLPPGSSTLAGRPEPTLIDEGEEFDTPTPRFQSSNSIPLPKKNIFIFPDDFVKTLSPVILIRHPARSVPSLHRGCEAVFGLEEPFGEVFRMFMGMELGLPRLVYEFWEEFFRGSDGNWPVVIDMDKLISDPQGVVERFCEIAGLDKAGVHYKWDPMPDEEFHQFHPTLQWFVSNVSKSSGIKRDEETLKTPNIDEDQEKWAKMYGKDAAATMRGLVDEAMEDYEFLRSKSI